MPVSRLLVRPAAEPVPTLSPADTIGLSVLPSAPGTRAPYAEPGLGSAPGAEAARTVGEPTPGATAIPPTAAPAPRGVEAGRAPIATVTGPLGPVRAARWNRQREA